MLKQSLMNEFVNVLSDRNLICFGAGSNFRSIVYERKWSVSAVVDTDESKVGSFVGNLRVSSWNDIEEFVKKDDVLLITPTFFGDLYNCIIECDALNKCDIYIYDLMKRLQYDADRDAYERNPVFYLQHDEKKIPRKIHYFWFSGDPYPDSVSKCIDSWKKYCPDYEIIKWDMNNYDFSENRFALEAIKHRKWAFASDYARADVIFRYGGIYLDTDVELVRGIDDFLYHDAFIGFQDSEEIDPGSGFGASPGNSIVGEFRDIYKNESFDLGNGRLNMIACPVFYTDVLERHGLARNGTYQMVDGFAVYPYDYFCPHSYMSGLIVNSSNTYSIHHHEGGWANKESREREKMAHDLIQRTYRNNGGR